MKDARTEDDVTSAAVVASSNEGRGQTTATMHREPPRPPPVPLGRLFRRKASLVRTLCRVSLAFSKCAREAGVHAPLTASLSTAGGSGGVVGGGAGGQPTVSTPSLARFYSEPDAGYLEFDLAEYRFHADAEYRWPRRALAPILRLPAHRTPEDVDCIQALMRQLRFCRRLPSDVLRRMASQAYYMRLEKGRDVLREGHIGYSFYMIFSGEVAVKPTAVGAAAAAAAFACDAEHIRLSKGDAFGERALLFESARNATVTTETRLSEFLIVYDDCFVESGLAGILADRVAAVETFLLQSSLLSCIDDLIYGCQVEQQQQQQQQQQHQQQQQQQSTSKLQQPESIERFPSLSTTLQSGSGSKQGLSPPHAQQRLKAENNRDAELTAADAERRRRLQQRKEHRQAIASSLARNCAQLDYLEGRRIVADSRCSDCVWLLLTGAADCCRLLATPPERGGGGGGGLAARIGHLMPGQVFGLSSLLDQDRAFSLVSRGCSVLAVAKATLLSHLPVTSLRQWRQQAQPIQPPTTAAVFKACRQQPSDKRVLRVCQRQEAWRRWRQQEVLTTVQRLRTGSDRFDRLHGQRLEPGSRSRRLVPKVSSRAAAASLNAETLDDANIGRIYDVNKNAGKSSSRWMVQRSLTTMERVNRMA